MPGKNSRTLYASAARTATPTAVTVRTDRARGCVIVVDATAATATPGVTVKVEGVCPTSGQVYTILASAAITAISVTTLTIYPGITAAANVSASAVLPQTIKVTFTHVDADSITYSASLVLID